MVLSFTLLSLLMFDVVIVVVDVVVIVCVVV